MSKKQTKSKNRFPELEWQDGIVIRITRSGIYYAAYFNRHPLYYNTAVFSSLDSALEHLLKNKDYWNNSMHPCWELENTEAKLNYLRQYFMEHDDGDLVVVRQEYRYL